MDEQQNIIIYRTADGKASVALYAKDGKIWLNQQQMAELFATSKPNISMHIANILKEKELSKFSVVKEYLTTAADGKNYNVALYAKDGKIWLNQQQMAELFATSKQTISYHIVNILKERELSKFSVVKEYLTTAADGKNYNVVFYSLEMIDRDLASVYGVSTSQLNQQVKRNIGRFPNSFRFQLTEAERDEVVTNCDNLRSLKFNPSLPYAFTEPGIAPLRRSHRVRTLLPPVIKKLPTPPSVPGAFSFFHFFILSFSKGGRGRCWLVLLLRRRMQLRWLSPVSTGT